MRFLKRDVLGLSLVILALVLSFPFAASGAERSGIRKEAEKMRKKHGDKVSYIQKHYEKLGLDRSDLGVILADNPQRVIEGRTGRAPSPVSKEMIGPRRERLEDLPEKKLDKRLNRILSQKEPKKKPEGKSLQDFDWYTRDLYAYESYEISPEGQSSSIYSYVDDTIEWNRWHADLSGTHAIAWLGIEPWYADEVRMSAQWKFWGLSISFSLPASVGFSVSSSTVTWSDELGDEWQMSCEFHDLDVNAMSLVAMKDTNSGSFRFGSDWFHISSEKFTWL